MQSKSLPYLLTDTFSFFPNYWSFNPEFGGGDFIRTARSFLQIDVLQ